MRTSKKHKTSSIIYDERIAGIVFTLPFTLGFIFFVVVPMLMSLYYAFCNYNILSPAVWCGLENFALIIHDPKFWHSLQVTLRYAAISVPLKLIFALLIALLLFRDTKLTPVYRAIYYLPSIIGSSVAVSLLWKRIFGLDGLVNQLLGLHIPWLGQVSTALLVLILLTVWQFGSSMLIFIASMKQIPQTLYEAARIDGANRWKCFFHITLPLLSSTIFFNLIMQSINGLLVFAQGQIITGGKPLNSTLFYVMYMYKQTFAFYNAGYASALGWILIALVTLLTCLLFLTKRFWVYDEGY